MRLLQLALILLVLLVPTPALTQTAEPSPVAEGEWQVTDLRGYDIDGVPIALSPDGRWIAGAGPDAKGVCVWAVEAMTSTCAGEEIVPYPFSIVWAPDSSAIAFFDGEPSRPEPNTLWLFTASSGALTVLDRAGVIHQAPAWTLDSTTVLYLAEGIDGKGSAIHRVSRAGGESHQVTGADLDVQEPLVATADGRVVFATGEEPALRLWIVELDGSDLERFAADIHTGTSVPTRLGGWGPGDAYLTMVDTHTTDAGRVTMRWYTLDRASGLLVPLDLPDVSSATTGPGWWSHAPEMLALGSDDGQAPLQLYTVDPHTGAARPLSGGTFDGDVTYWTLSFGADGQAMVATVGTVWLMTLEYRS